MRLLGSGAAGVVHINDCDPLVHAFWSAVVADADRFIERIWSVPLTVDEWRRQRFVQQHSAEFSPFDVGFAAFFLNRCSRSGLITRSGPIGGYAQGGPWRVDARFNRAELSKRVAFVGEHRGRIHVYGLDAVDFLRRMRRRNRVFIYLDPPYVLNGSRLYLNHYRDADHRRLASYVLRWLRGHPWVLSYDDAPLIRGLYAPCVMVPLSIRHSVQNKGRGTEVLILPPDAPPSAIANLPGRI